MPARAGKALLAGVALGVTAFKLGTVVYKLVRPANGEKEATLLDKMLEAGTSQLESLFGSFSEAQRVKNERLERLSEEAEEARGEASDLRQKCASQLNEINVWKARALKAEATTKESERLIHKLSLESGEHLAKLLEATEELSKLKDANKDLTAQLSKLKVTNNELTAQLSAKTSAQQLALVDTDEASSTGNDDLDLFEAEVDKMVTLASGHVLHDRNQNTAVPEGGRKSLRVRLTVLEKEHGLLKRGMEAAVADRDALKRKLKETEEAGARRAAAMAKEKKKLQKKLQQYSEAQVAAKEACTEAELLASESGQALAQAQTQIKQLEGKAPNTPEKV